MDGSRFDALARTVGRRRFLGSLMGALGLAAAQVTAARPKRKEPRFNEFFCVPVGKPCRGKDRYCCSGICNGRKPKQGKRDRSQCLAHDADVCQAGQREAACGGSGLATCATGPMTTGFCNTTTGNAGFCTRGAVLCAGCTRDVDCQATTGDPGAACIRCTSCPNGTACVTP